MLPADLIEEIDAYKEEHRIRTKNETIRTLILKGLEAEAAKAEAEASKE